MKRTATFIIASLLMAAGAYAQEPGSYLIVGGGLGMSGFTYKTPNLQNVSRRHGLGLHGNVGYSYFFNQHWGLGIGLQVGNYSTTIRFSDYHYSKDNLLDYEQLEDPLYPRIEYYRQDVYLNPHYLKNADSYNTRPSLDGRWRERQRALMLDIPIQLLFQHRFDKKKDENGEYKQDEYGEKSRWGMYANLGLKLQLPLNPTYRAGGLIATESHFGDYYLDLYDLSDEKHGQFNRGYNANGKNIVTAGLGVAAAAEVGMLYALRPCIDLYVGAYADLGATSVNRRNERSIIDATVYLNEEGNPRNGIQYQSVMNSSEAGSARTLSLGGKIGLRIRLFGCKKKEDILQPTPDTCPPCDTVRDTVFLPVYITIPTRAELEDLYEVVDHFSSATAHMDDFRKAQIRRKIDIMKKYPNMEITLVGHTCDYGTPESNMMLGMRRAQHLKRYMVEQGVNPNNITIESRGLTEPRVPNTTEENRQLNRRVEVTGKHLRSDDSTVVYRNAPNAPAPVSEAELDSLRKAGEAYRQELERATKLASAANDAPGLLYKIQVSTLQEPIADLEKEFDRYGFTHEVDVEVNEYLTAVTYVYLTGRFERFDEARRELLRIQRAGITDAFMVPYYNGSRITMNEANERAAKHEQAKEEKESRD